MLRSTLLSTHLPPDFAKQLGANYTDTRLGAQRSRPVERPTCREPCGHYRLNQNLGSSSADMEFTCSYGERRCSCLPLALLNYDCDLRMHSGIQAFNAALPCNERLQACNKAGVGLIGTVAVCSRTEEPGEQRFCHHQRLKQPMGLPFSEWADNLAQNAVGLDTPIEAFEP